MPSGKEARQGRGKFLTTRSNGILWQWIRHWEGYPQIIGPPRLGLRINGDLQLGVRPAALITVATISGPIVCHDE